MTIPGSDPSLQAVALYSHTDVVPTFPVGFLVEWKSFLDLTSRKIGLGIMDSILLCKFVASCHFSNNTSYSTPKIYMLRECKNRVLAVLGILQECWTLRRSVRVPALRGACETNRRAERGCLSEVRTWEAATTFPSRLCMEIERDCNANEWVRKSVANMRIPTDKPLFNFLQLSDASHRDFRSTINWLSFAFRRNTRYLCGVRCESVRVDHSTNDLFQGIKRRAIEESSFLKADNISQSRDFLFWTTFSHEVFHSFNFWSFR